MRLKLLSAVILSIVGVLGLASPALASDAAQPIPDDVLAAYSTQALHDVRVEATDIGHPDLRDATAFGDPHRVALWSSEYISGIATERPLEPIDEWVAPILDSRGDALGTYRVWRPAAGAPATYAAHDGEAQRGAALAELAPDSLVVDDGPTGSWFSVRGGIVAPLDEHAATLVPDAAPLQDAQTTIHSAHLDALESVDDIDAAVGGVGPLDTTAQNAGGTDAARLTPETMVLFAVAIAIVIAGAGVAVVIPAIRRHRRRRA